MYQTINRSQFHDAFSDDRKNQFSYEGKNALFEHLEQYEEDTGEQIELDTITLCCDYTEYDDFESFQAEYSRFDNIEQIQDETIFIPIEGTERFIIQNF